MGGRVGCPALKLQLLQILYCTQGTPYAVASHERWARPPAFLLLFHASSHTRLATCLSGRLQGQFYCWPSCHPVRDF
jgi:hypothetical protein